ncbi:DUF4253 domain-containing protein [Streptomyces sp. S.PB5]|uniref:DUF4253 domain-containing protein n=1 Tax=Streptomyces sp. S.PB5 TaxID=3020844 RepID=UPI0025B0E2BA|nr:DUF4253 domain-containing protein [Streptomyces sp. S.PB5]MDN3024602.1 DUF4253 domain-containing protein [Streptomyces sp. S.PB5]
MEPKLPQSLPPGKIIESYGRSAPLVWMSDGHVPDADDWWRRLYAERARTGLYPVLLEYCEDFSELNVGRNNPVDVATYLRGRWRPGSWPSFPQWPGLAAPAATGLDPDVRAAEVATHVVREHWAHCLALVQVERGADAAAALHWPGSYDALTALLHSWEDRFDTRVVAFTHGGMFLSAAIPPKDLHEAHVLASEHYLACPDVFHNNFDDWENTYPQELLTQRQWYFWWD